jgi:hypothetical protein
LEGGAYRVLDAMNDPAIVFRNDGLTSDKPVQADSGVCDKGRLSDHYKPTAEDEKPVDGHGF